MMCRTLPTLLCLVTVSLASCASTDSMGHDGVIRVKPYDAIPPSAVSVATGMDHVEWSAETTGRVWVGDDTSKRLLASRPVRPGDLVLIDVSDNLVKLNADVVYDGKLDSEHRYSVFFR